MKEGRKEGTKGRRRKEERNESWKEGREGGKNE
jgi:hypothetical protein